MALGIFIFFVLSNLTTVYRLFHHRSQQDVIQEVFKNRQIFDVVISSQQVTAQSLHSKYGSDWTILDGYDKGLPVSISPSDAQKIKDLLQSPSSYLWNIGNTCIPDYGVLFNFCSGAHTVRVALCFKCQMVGVFNGEDDKAEQVNREYIMKPMREPLIAICKTIFPDDKEIQALK